MNVTVVSAQVGSARRAAHDVADPGAEACRRGSEQNNDPGDVGPRPTIGHVVAEYLPRSATFIYTVVRFQRNVRPVVLAGRTRNVSEFPTSTVVELAPPDAGTHRRIGRRLVALASGCRTTDAHRIWHEAQRHGCVALHAHFGPVGYESLTARRRLGIPLITAFYGHDVALPQKESIWADRYARLFAEGTLFLCEGPSMAGRLAAIGCPQTKIRIVKIGVDLAQFPFAPRAAARPFIVVQTARFVEKKGIDLSIRAFAAAREHLGSSELWLIGDGPERARLEALTVQLGLTSRVRFLGLLSHSEYREVMAHVGAAIQPSRIAADGDTEGGAPTVLLEMQAAGIPVVATHHADIPAVVPEPERLVDEEDVGGLADALVELASLPDDEGRARAERARAFVAREHDAAMLAGSIEQMYTEALGVAGGALRASAAAGDQARGAAHA